MQHSLRCHRLYSQFLRGKNGLVMPYDDVAASTIMLVVKRPTTTYGDIVGNYSDISGSTSDGVHIYWTSGTVYCDICVRPLIAR